MSAYTRKEFFQHFRFKGLTFDDVRTIPAHAEVLPHAVDLRSRISRRVPIQIPFASAAMTDVTEDRFVIEIAMLGGIGFIHRKISPERQAEMVRRGKLQILGTADRPESARHTETIAEVQARIEERGLPFHRFPVVDANDKIVGILDSKRFNFYADKTTHISEVMTTTFVMAPQNTTMDEAYELMCARQRRILPLHDTDGRLAGMYIFSDIERIRAKGTHAHTLDDTGHLRIGAAIGVGDEGIRRMELLADAKVDVVAIDTSHGDSKDVFAIVRRIKTTRAFDGIDIIAGNVATGEAAAALADLGADGIKVGVGGGSICTTRTVSGTGIPQVTAVYNVAKALEKTDVTVISDGGIRSSGDIVIALAAGAHCVMAGMLFAGCEETPGDVIRQPNGARVKKYRGMGSPALLRGAPDRYGQQSMKADLVAEGVEAFVPYKGPLRDAIKDYIGGLRIGMGYVGAATIEELRTTTNFIQQTEAGMAESKPHDVILVADALPGSKES